MRGLSINSSKSPPGCNLNGQHAQIDCTTATLSNAAPRACYGRFRPLRPRPQRTDLILDQVQGAGTLAFPEAEASAFQAGVEAIRDPYLVF